MSTVSQGVKRTESYVYNSLHWAFPLAPILALSTAFDGLMPFATSDLHIRYLEPARGETRAEAQVVRISARGGVTECRLHCGDTIVALCTAHFAIKANLPG